MRIGISMPDNLLDRFDQIIEKQGYSSRSEGIRDALRSYILYDEWMSEVQGDRIGVVSIVYSLNKRKLIHSLMQVQNENASLTLSTVRKYLDDENCMDIFILQGDGGSIRDFAEKMMAIKGVKHVKLTTILPAGEI